MLIQSKFLHVSYFKDLYEYPYSLYLQSIYSSITNYFLYQNLYFSYVLEFLGFLEVVALVFLVVLLGRGGMFTLSQLWKIRNELILPDENFYVLVHLFEVVFFDEFIQSNYSNFQWNISNGQILALYSKLLGTNCKDLFFYSVFDLQIHCHLFHSGFLNIKPKYSMFI